MTRSFARSNELYERASRTVPLASQTFSKSAMMYVRGAAPLFLERGDGVRVWDVDGNAYIDFVLGLLPVVLGYRDPDVDAAIRAQLDCGITFSLSTELEVELSEMLTRLIPCAEMVRFGKNGSDATTAAIRLARAHTGRDRIAICGYHGWHDWYIGTTARHLGVPRAVRELSDTFDYNDADSLDRLIRARPGQYAAVVMEPTLAVEPAPGFLEAVRAICDRDGIVLVFDEIITGFRTHLGGAQAVYGVTPDLSSFGKAMANGMPISAIVGKREIMRQMENVFVSGTFGGECLSLAAAIATINKIEKVDAIERTKAAGRRLAEGIAEILKRHDLAENYGVSGPDWRPLVLPEGPVDRILAVSLLRQELNENGILSVDAINLCLAHDDDVIIKEALAAWDRTAENVAQALRSNDPASYLRGEPVQPVFQVRASPKT
jgi:glutamate-1-semialdehyde 2,1-aminomutase